MNGISTAFTGRLGGDPELRYSAQGKPRLSFSVAVDENTQATEERAAPDTTWVRVTAWNDAEMLGERLRKGASVYVEGRLKLDRWTGKDGEPRHGLSVSAWRVDLHGQLGKQAPDRVHRGYTHIPAVMARPGQGTPRATILVE